MRISLIMTVLVFATACTGAADHSSGPLERETAEKTREVASSPGKPLHPIQVHAVVSDPVKAGVESEAELVVTSSLSVESVEVEMEPEYATVVSENRFYRQAGAENAGMPPGGPMAFKFRFRPASDEPQPLTVRVRVTDETGRVLTREVAVSLAGEGKGQPVHRKPRIEVVEDVPEPEGDAVVPARQDVRREGDR